MSVDLFHQNFFRNLIEISFILGKRRYKESKIKPSPETLTSTYTTNCHISLLNCNKLNELFLLLFRYATLNKLH